MFKDLLIIKPFKKSGQKEVYLAKHKSLGFIVYKKGKCNSEHSLKRIIREVELLQSIESPSFPKNYDFHFDSAGNFEILEEYIESKKLGDCQDIFDNEKAICNLGLQIIDAMTILWDNRVVHRDLKPDNILIRNNMQPVIIDLGIARDLDASSLTKTLQHRGPCTPFYAAPEQLRNLKNTIDMRTDFFALGIIFAELLLKKHPFHPELVGTGLGIVENIENDRYSVQNGAIKMSSIFEGVIKSLLQHMQYKRYRTHQLFKEALNQTIAIGG